MKYNLYIMKTSTWTQLAFCLLSSVFYACNSSHVYYLDATSGSDQNNGTSPRSAWQSIEALKQISLQPGDKILFKKGETFPGILEVTGKGTYTHPIIIDAYGKVPAPRPHGSAPLLRVTVPLLFSGLHAAGCRC